MSTISFLSAELASLASEAKRRSPEIKNAAERSLGILRGISREDEASALKHLAQNADFITPLLLSCSSRNAKFSTIAIPAIQKLIQGRAIPISKIDILLEALIEATHLAVDIQLKVLQILPTFFQIYGEFINDALVAKLLLICSMLQTPSKIPMVVNTAAATQQQIVLSLFDKIVEEDKSDVLKEYEVTVDDGRSLKVSASAFDAYRVFSDICILIEHQKACFLPISVLSESFGFELLEIVLTNYKDVLLSHVELGFLLRTKLTPLLLRSFSNHKQFPIVVRVARIVLLLIKAELPILEIEAEVILSLLTHVVTSESKFPLWKKVLALEIFNAICGDSALTRAIFETYDFAEDKKKVVTEFFTACSDVLDERWAKSLLNTNDIVAVPPVDFALTASNSSPRVLYIDLLDKTEIPPPPKTYTLFLILSCTTKLCDGIGKELLEVSETGSNALVFLANEAEEPPSPITYLKSLIRSNAKSLVTIGTEFLYSCLGNDLFHSLIRSLQKLCHASGVLGLSNERDSLLLLFSIATVTISVKGDVRHPSVSDTIAGTVSGAINAISTVRETAQPKRIKLPSRNLNPRHVICFRALVSLAISLGPLLEHSWRFILITFQWFDYFVNGPSEYLSFKELPSKPELQSADLKLIESSLSKFIESTKNYEPIAYQKLIRELVEVGKDAILGHVNSNDPLVGDDFVVCGYNRDFFLHKIKVLSSVNATRYLHASNEDWKFLSSFLSQIITTAKAEPELRVIACVTFNSTISEISKAGFGPESPVNKMDLERKLFQSFSDVVDRMLDFQNTEYFSKAESEIILGTLKTLYELLDRYGTQFTVSWEIIVHIINSPFAYFEKSQNAHSQKALLKSSFEILQLVLNDFLQALPLRSIKDVIDVLEHFCCQSFDLNISFSAVSYYWLLSDYCRSVASTEKEETYPDDRHGDLLDTSNTSDSVTVHSLWLYVLGSLVNVSKDSRPDVKNGAVQTFFRIVDSHGAYLDWDRTFKVVVQRMLDAEVIKVQLQDIDLAKSFIESNSIIIRGLSDIYGRYLLQSHNTEYLTALLVFFNKYTELDIPQLSEITYKSFHQICNVVENCPPDIFSLLFDFWSSQPVKYVSVDLDLYQNNLVELVLCFPRLHQIQSFSRAQIGQTLALFNNTIRFPFLPKYVSDLESPTKLQSAVLDALGLLDIHQESDLIFSQLSSIIQLPLQTRTRILKKLQNLNRNEVPSFIGVSVEGLKLLEQKLADIGNFHPLIKNKTVSKIFRSLLEAVTYESNDSVHSLQLLQFGIWKRSLNLLSTLVQNIAPSLDSDEDNRELWTIVIDIFMVTLPENNRGLDEEFNLKVYNELKNVFLNTLINGSLASDLIHKYVSSILGSSTLYQNTELESFLFDSCDSPVEISNGLLELKFDDYSTAPITPLAQQEFRFVCLKDLFGSCRKGVADSLLECALPYLLCRVVMIIKRFSGSQRLLNHAPVSTVQQRELSLCLHELYSLLQELNGSDASDYHLLLKVFPLILDNHHFIGKLGYSDGVLTGITREFYKVSNK